MGKTEITRRRRETNIQFSDSPRNPKSNVNVLFVLFRRILIVFFNSCDYLLYDSVILFILICRFGWGGARFTLLHKLI